MSIRGFSLRNSAAVATSAKEASHFFQRFSFQPFRFSLTTHCVTIFIARDGDMIGEYPHHQLEAMARAGHLRPDDDYWHEGMGEWSTLDKFIRRRAWEPVVERADAEANTPSPAPPFWQTMDRRLLFGGIGATVLAVLLILFLVARPSSGPVSPTPAMDAAAELALRDKAAADLRARIERLPVTAKPPLNTFYYDVRVSMEKHFNPRVPWSALIHGSANKVDANGQTLSRTDFDLTTDYEEGEWVHDDYQETVTTFSENGAETSKEIQRLSTPTSIAGIMGLKIRPKLAPIQMSSLKIEDAGATPSGTPATLVPPILTQPPGK